MKIGNYKNNNISFKSGLTHKILDAIEQINVEEVNRFPSKFATIFTLITY